MKKSSFLKGEGRQHFGLRKLSVGVASVLLGTTFMLWGGSQVRADSLNNNNRTQSEIVAQQKQEPVETVKANEAQAQTAQSANLQRQEERNETNLKVTAANNAAKQSLTIANSKQANQTNAAALAENKGVQNNQVQTAAEPAVHYNNPEEVRDWNGFTSALRNRNVDAIVLDNDIYATGPYEFALNSAAHDWQDWNISRKLTITSKDVNHRSTINFGNHFISFWDQNHRWYRDNNTPWDITLKDVNITNTNRVFSPFFFNNESVREANKDRITFDNVNQDGDMLLRSEQVNVELKGNVNINSHLHNGDYSAIYAHSVKIDPNASVTMNVTDDTYSQYLMGNAAIHIVNAPNNWTGVEVGENATLSINPDVTSHNTKGIITTGANNVVLDPGARVEMNLGTGNSTGIFGAQNLILNEGSSLKIKTAEDNNGVVAWGADNNGHHVSPITLGYNRGYDAASTLDIKNGASLKIVRSDSNCPSIDALISFGGTSSNAQCQFNLNVEDGATLDLQDAAHSNWHAYGTNLANYLGNQNYLYNTGMIAMYGVDSYDHVNFGNVKYVNLQRSGYQHGILMRLEGGCNPCGDNAITIKGNEMPLSQWVAGNYSKNADYTWHINSLYTQNKVGDFSYNYNGRYQRVYVYPNYYQRWYGLDFADANANVQFSDGSSLYDHQDFNHNFNWWSPQRIAFGSALARNYHASVEDANALTTHVNATTAQTPSLNVDNIVLTWRDDDGNVVKAPAGYTIAWRVAPDTSKATAAGQPDRTGSVLIVLKNGKQQIVSVPVNVLSAKTQHDGFKIRENDSADLPTAAYMTDTSDVNRFGIKDIQWTAKPDISKPGAQVYGQTRVDYNDGTSQYLNPYLDVLEVTNGQDHKDDKDVYIESVRYVRESGPNGGLRYVRRAYDYARTRTTDYAYPVGDSRRVSYTDWQIVSEHDL